MSAEYEFGIVAKFTDEASSGSAQTVGTMSSQWREFHAEQLGVTHSFQMNNAALYDSTRIIGTVGHVGTHLLSMYNSWNIAQIRLQESQTNLSDSTQRYQYNLAVLGPMNEQTIRAHQDMVRAQQNLQITQTQINQQLVLMAVSSLSLVPQIVKLYTEFGQLASVLNGVRDAGIGAAAATQAASAGSTVGLLGFVGVVGLSAAAIAGLAYAQYQYSQMTPDQRAAIAFSTPAGGRLAYGRAGGYIGGPDAMFGDNTPWNWRGNTADQKAGQTNIYVGGNVNVNTPDAANMGNQIARLAAGGG